jgi:hypothetical protein
MTKRSASLIGRIPIIILFTLVGAYDYSITIGLILGFGIFGGITMVAWWVMFMWGRPNPNITKP